MNRNVIPVLTGNDSNKANQLIELLKERNLSPEQLEKLLPLHKEFYVQLNENIKAQIEADKICNINAVNALKSTLDKLVDQLSNTASPQERQQIVEVVKKLADNIKEIEINRDNNSSSFKRFLGFLGAVLLFFLGMLAASKNGSKTNDRS